MCLGLLLERLYEQVQCFQHSSLSGTIWLVIFAGKNFRETGFQKFSWF